MKAAHWATAAVLLVALACANGIGAVETGQDADSQPAHAVSQQVQPSGGRKLLSGGPAKVVVQEKGRIIVNHQVVVNIKKVVAKIKPNKVTKKVVKKVVKKVYHPKKTIKKVVKKVVYYPKKVYKKPPPKKITYKSPPPPKKVYHKPPPALRIAASPPPPEAYPQNQSPPAAAATYTTFTYYGVGGDNSGGTSSGGANSNKKG